MDRPIDRVAGRFGRRAALQGLAGVWFGALLGMSPVRATAARATSSEARDSRRVVEQARGRVGVHLMLGDGRKKWSRAVWPEHITFAADLVGPGGVVIQMLQGDQMHPGRWQLFFDAVGAAELRPIVRLATTFDHKRRRWRAPSPDPNGISYHRLAERYSRFLASRRWPSGEQYVIVGNEPNRGDEWGNRPDPAAYVRFLADMADALHARGFRVLNAGLDAFCPHSNDELIDGVRYQDAGSFLDGMLAADPRFFDRLDGWAAHSYPLGPFGEPPERQELKFDRLNGATAVTIAVSPAGVVNRGVNGYGWELWRLGLAGMARDLPIFITETGWRHREADRLSPNDAAGGAIDSTTAGAYGVRALFGPANDGRFVPWLADPRVAVVVFFALDGDSDYWSHTNWLHLDSGGHVVGTYPQYEALRQALRPPPGAS